MNSNATPPLVIVPSLVDVFLFQDPETALGVLYCGHFFAGNNAGQNMGNKSWRTLGNPFLEVVPKPSGKQSHKGGCPQEAQIRFIVTVLGSSLVSNWFGGC